MGYLNGWKYTSRAETVHSGSCIIGRFAIELLEFVYAFWRCLETLETTEISREIRNSRECLCWRWECWTFSSAESWSGIPFPRSFDNFRNLEIIRVCPDDREPVFSILSKTPSTFWKRLERLALLGKFDRSGRTSSEENRLVGNQTQKFSSSNHGDRILIVFIK